MNVAYIALGSNLGDRLGHLRAAVERLEASGRVGCLRASPVYQNRAVGMGDADDFLNAVIEVESCLEPLALLELCLAVENELGRVRSGVWAPRTIDLDLLWYAGLDMDTERLQLPHPRIRERDFVAQPLADLVPELRVFGVTVAEILAALPSIDLELMSESLIVGA